MSSGSLNEKHVFDEKKHGNFAISTREVDTAAEVALGDQSVISIGDALRVR